MNKLVDLQKRVSLPVPRKEPLLRKRYRIVIKAFLDRDSFIETNSPEFFDQFKDSLKDRLDHCGILKETIVLEIMEVKSE